MRKIILILLFLLIFIALLFSLKVTFHKFGVEIFEFQLLQEDIEHNELKAIDEMECERIPQDESEIIKGIKWWKSKTFLEGVCSKRFWNSWSTSNPLIFEKSKHTITLEPISIPGNKCYYSYIIKHGKNKYVCSKITFKELPEVVMRVGF